MEINILEQDSPNFDVVAQWVFAEWGPISPFETLSSTRVAMSHRTGQQNLPCAFLAHSANGCPYGTVSLVECDYAPRGDLTPWVADMYVDPAYRNRGIGSALVGYLEQQARAGGISNLYLITRHQKHFYQQLGWTVLNELYYQEVVAVLMKRNLPL